MEYEFNVFYEDADPPFIGPFSIAHDKASKIIGGNEVLEPSKSIVIHLDLPYLKNAAFIYVKKGGNWTRSEIAKKVRASHKKAHKIANVKETHGITWDCIDHRWLELGLRHAPGQWSFCMGS